MLSECRMIGIKKKLGYKRLCDARANKRGEV